MPESKTDHGLETDGTDAAIRVRKLYKRYDGATIDAVSDVSFEVARGEIFTLLGPSGCGKTTTLRLIAGLEVPNSGNIHFGQNLMTARHVLVAPDRRDVGMVFQTGAIWPHMTIQQNVAFPLKARGVSRPEINRRVAEILELVGLQGLEDRPAPLLSGGQQQRVALARALVTEPAVLLLDEPFNSLDASLREQMRLDVKRLQQRLNITTLFVTHDQNEALVLSDRIGLMRDGVLQQYGSPRQLYEQPANQFVGDFLGKTVLLQGTRQTRDVNGNYTILLDGGSGALIETRTSPPQANRLVVALRPEDLEVITYRQSPQQPPGTLAGIVRTVRFCGDRMEYQIEVPEQGVIEAYGGRHSVAAEGQAIWLRLHGEGHNMWPLESQ